MIIYDELFKRASFQFNIILTYMTFLKKMTIDLWPIMRWKDVTTIDEGYKNVRINSGSHVGL